MKNMLKMLLVTLMLVALLPSIAFAGINDYPRSDEMYSVICADETVTMSKATAGEIDTAFDVRSATNVATLQGLGWQLTALLGFGFHYIGLNCQNVTPASSGVYYDFYGRVPGMSLFPMNVSEFRFALHLIIAPYKQQIISEVFDWTSIKIDTCPTPAAGSAWVATMTFPSNPWAEALSLLNSAGFSNSTGDWVHDGSRGPAGEIRAGFGGAFEKTILCMGAPEAATSTSLVTMKFKDKWNQFFGKNSAAGDYFVYASVPWVSMVKVFSWNHDYDLYGAGWRVGRDPDYLYDFFHPAVYFPGGSNHPGLNYKPLNDLLEELKYTLDKTTGEVITDIAVLQAKCKAAQQHIFYMAPYIVNRAAVTPNLFGKHMGVTGWVESLGYTADNGYTYDFLMKTGTGTVKFGNPGTVGTLNPLVASTVYEWNILNRIFDGFINVDPFTKDDRMWAISSYTMVPYNDVGKNIKGLNITFYIRDTIRWHDGLEYNASSAKFSWDFLNSTKAPRYSAAWMFYLGSEVLSRLTVRCYLNITGFWYLYDMAGVAMMFCKPVWQPFYGDYNAAKVFSAWTTNYDTHTGKTGHGGLKCLVGTGTWVFVELSTMAQTARLMANRPFSIGASVWDYTGRYWAYKFIREDINWDGKVDITDVSTTIAAYGSKPGHPRWKDGQCDLNNDNKVDITDVASSIAKYGRKTLPPYP